MSYVNKNKLKKITFIREAYYKFKENKVRKSRLNGKFKLIDRRKKSNKLCYILAGYKSFVWEDVFARIKTFITEDIDVCILSSGIYSEELARYAQKYNWSYMYTKINNISLSQNLLINEFKDVNTFIESFKTHLFPLNIPTIISNKYTVK